MFFVKNDCSLSPRRLKTELLKLSTQIFEESNRELGQDLHVSIATYDKHRALNSIALLPESRFHDRTSPQVLDWFRGAVVNREVGEGEVLRLATESFLKS